MKHILPILFFHLAIFADYSMHPDAQDVIDELIYKHGFEEEYVISILQMAEKQPKIIIHTRHCRIHIQWIKIKLTKNRLLGIKVYT